MEEPFKQRDDLHGYSDREILLLIVQEVRYSLPIINKRLDAHANSIRGLQDWRNYLAGAWAVLAAAIGFKSLGPH